MSDTSLPRGLLNSLLNCEYFKTRDAESVELLRLVRRPVSTVCQLRVHFRHEKRLYWIKMHAEDSCGNGEQEYRFLKDASGQFCDVPQLSICEPVAYLKDYNAFITEHASGTPFSTLIKRRLNRITSLLGDNERIKHNCYLCGKWLAILHTDTHPSGQRYNLEELLEYVDVRLKMLIDRWESEKEFCGRVRSYLQQIVPRVPDTNLTRVKTHGDYAPYNVLVSDGGLQVFDPDTGGYFGQLGNYCCRYEDIVHFHNWVRGMSSPIVDEHTRRELASLFLQGYTDNSGFVVDESSPAFKAFLLKYKLLDALGSWPSIVGRLTPARGQIRVFHRWFEETCTL